MGYPQPPTPVQTDNSTACGIANDNIKQQRSRAIDMRFYWVRDRVKQNQFHIYWGPGKLNLADYYSKHHPPVHHQQM
jgi:predicted transposase YdaD